jgi:predicted GNAT family acetyltransferase
VFGWFEAGGEVRGAVSLTPPYDLLLAAVPADTLAELVDVLRAEHVAVPGVNGTGAMVDAFAEAWTAGAPLRADVAMEMCLYRLGELQPPASPPPGRARAAVDDEFETLVRWMAAFQAEAGMPATATESMVRERLDDDRMWLWEDESGHAVAIASRTATVAGVARIAPVYTPPEHRRRGYGAAVTAACTADGLERGAEHVVLYTDLANPTSNSIYRQIGFRPIGDHRVVRFEG